MFYFSALMKREVLEINSAIYYFPKALNLSCNHCLVSSWFAFATENFSLSGLTTTP